MKHVTKIISHAVMKDLLRQFKVGGYDIEKTSETVIVSLDGTTVFKGLAHSTGKNWLVKYDKRLIQGA